MAWVRCHACGVEHHVFPELKILHVAEIGFDATALSRGKEHPRKAELLLALRDAVVRELRRPMRP